MTDPETVVAVKGPNEWNPRYVRYADLQGRTPGAQLTHDREAWPGGCMCGFTLWISANMAVFRRLSPQSFMANGGALADQDAWDAFLVGDLVLPPAPPR